MFFLEKKNQFKSFSRRSFFLLSLKLFFFGIVGVKLFNIQIKNSLKYETLSNNNRIKLKIIFPTRGKILDRNNNVIATNHVTYDLYIIPEQIRDIEEVLEELSNVIPISFKQKKQTISLSNKVKKFEMIKIVDNLNWPQLERIESNMYKFPGVHLISNYRRHYPYANYFSHIIGYTSQPSKKDLKLPYISSMPTLDIGKTGVEKYFNESLIGAPGNKEVEINAYGREIREISIIKSIDGKKISLSLDLRIQETILKELQNNKAGSIVVINVNSGEIIGMLSVPDFDPNKLISKPNDKYWKQILENPLAPLNNRATQGLYAPGSTFKMIVALAALKKQIINLDSSVNCTGKIEFGDRLYHCWKTEGHGRVSLLRAIKESCDCYFYKLAEKVGIEDMHEMSMNLGLGNLTNIELPSEKKGLVPNKNWKKKKYKQSWYAGETLITGIGQGYVLTTPLQMAVMTALIANEGKRIKPTLIKKTEDVNISELSDIPVNKDHIKIVKTALFKAVNEPMGTAYRIKTNPEKYNLAGKTGTSQVKRITIEEREQEDFRKKEIDWKDKDHSLFVGYMPADRPKFAISVVIEHGGSGSAIAAPIARRIFDKIYELSI